MMMLENPSALDMTISSESFPHIPTISENERLKFTPVRYNRVRLNVAVKDIQMKN